MYERTIIKIRRSALPPPTLPSNTETLDSWLLAQATRQECNFRWLLAHTDNGVIWGEVRSGTLHLSGATNVPREQLQQCRLFGVRGELLLWRGPSFGARSPIRSDDLQVRLLIDEAPGDDAKGLTECIDENHLLWGWATRQDMHNGFIRLVEGAQGIVHVPPLQQPPGEDNRASLRVRHYLAEDTATGMLQIVESRLMELVEPKVEKNRDSHS
jgi:CRISPR-associated protein (TIGR03984 family)